MEGVDTSADAAAAVDYRQSLLPPVVVMLKCRSEGGIQTEEFSLLQQPWILWKKIWLDFETRLLPLLYFLGAANTWKRGSMQV